MNDLGPHGAQIAANSSKRCAKSEHAEAQRLGRTEWYTRYRVRIATVTRDYGTD